MGSRMWDARDVYSISAMKEMLKWSVRRENGVMWTFSCC
jgi:hypothetical protein